MPEETLPEFELPEFLALSPERVSANETNQEIWKTRAVGRDAITDERSRAVLIERDALAVLDHLKADYPQVCAGTIHNENVQAVLKREFSRLAEAVAAQGRFDEAAQIESNSRKAKKYAEMWAAVWRDDSETCECPDYETRGGKQILNDVYQKNVFSLKHGAEMALIGCNKCGFLNVRPLTLLLQNSIKNQEWRRSQN